MSETIYRCLLRLYPERFRAEYGNDALQLFRDRIRDELGLFPRVRLWADLLIDLATSIPLEHSRRPVVASFEGQVNAAPIFFVLEGAGPRMSALISASVIWLSFLIGFSIFLTREGNQNLPVDSAFAAGAGGLLNHAQGSPENQNPELTAQRQTDRGTNLDAVERQRVVAAAIDNLNRYYVDADAAQKTVEALRIHEQRGDDDGATTGEAFAALLTKQMREASGDKHLDLVYSINPIAEHPPQPTEADRERFRHEMERQNCTFEKVEILPPNIGYLKFNFFPEPSVCGKTAAVAMARVNQADALIFDLRENRGGIPDMVQMMAAYLFDHPEYWFNPRENTTLKSWTQSPVPGNHLADKPVYLLTSKLTYSGAEHFCYDLKMLKRATLVGETTGGAAHSGVFHRLDEHFGIGIREVNPINPYGQPDWEGVGVEPDVKVGAGAALDTAVKLARAKGHK